MVSDRRLKELRAAYMQKLAYLGPESTASYKRGYLHGKIDLIDKLLEEI